jgi:hypothetical protein
VRPVTQTDVVRAGTRDVAKIFQILYDVNAVNGPGSYTYLGANADTTISRRAVGTIHPAENSPSMNSSSMSTVTLHHSKGSDLFIDSAIGSSSSNSNNHSINGPLNLDDYSTRISSDAISVGSNDSGDVGEIF